MLEIFTHENCTLSHLLQQTNDRGLQTYDIVVKLTSVLDDIERAIHSIAELDDLLIYRALFLDSLF